MTAGSESIQRRFYPDFRCFGCGPANPDGLRLESIETAVGATAWFTPRPAHDNGFGFLNGGVIATVLDCHSAAVVVLEASKRGWVLPGGSPVSYVTSGIDVRFLRPAPLGRLLATAELSGADETAMTVEARLINGDKVCASAHATWKRFRARGREQDTREHG